MLDNLSVRNPGWCSHRAGIPVLLSALVLFLCAMAPAQKSDSPTPTPTTVAGAKGMTQEITEGALRVNTTAGVVECPLKHTDVQVAIAGFVARATVTQTFTNPYDQPIEAVYVFPLPHEAAVDSMTMVLGDRRIIGEIQKRDDARRTYDRAIREGRTASLLEQERPNIFTQTVGNIKPKQEVKIEISYIDVLKYDQGAYEFHFPMVVGPRYTAGTGDAERITTPVQAPGMRTGHDISLSLFMNAGVPIEDLKVIDHDVEITRDEPAGAKIVLKPEDAIPNKDFILTYKVAGEKPQSALLAYAKNSNDGYFMLMMQPALDAQNAKTFPRELTFMLDVSGSMLGEPLEKTKAVMHEFLTRCRTNDSLQVVLFASKAVKLFPHPVPVTPDNIEIAVKALDNYAGGGTTEMVECINTVLDEPIDPARVRVGIMLTDGYIGNEDQVIKVIKERVDDQVRFWALGIGDAPNRYLLDGIANQGGGMSKVISLKTDPATVASEVVERIHRAQVANINIDWNGLRVSEVYPTHIPELWVGRPVVLYGRYAGGGSAPVTLSGVAEGLPVAQQIRVQLPANDQPAYDVLASIWARKKIDDLTVHMLSEEHKTESIAAITRLALDYRIMSKYTSFVAVDSEKAPEAPPTPPKRVDVPKPLPKGVAKPPATTPRPVLSPTSTSGAPAAPDADFRLRSETLSMHGAVSDGRMDDTMLARTSTSYIGGGGGDPWIVVTAPEDARQVVAIFPDGGAKPLHFDAKSGAWRLRFDFPLGTAPGLYTVSVVVVKADATRVVYTLTYQNLPVGSAITAEAGKLSAKPGDPLVVSVRGAGIQRAVALLPWGVRQTMTAEKDTWTANVTIPADYIVGVHTVTVVLLDGAHNRTQITLDVEVR